MQHNQAVQGTHYKSNYADLFHIGRTVLHHFSLQSKRNDEGPVDLLLE